jgi:hypothetical protein
MLSSLRVSLLIASFALASSAQAQFRPVEIPARPIVLVTPAPMPTYPSLTSPSLTTPSLAAPAPLPTFEPAAPAIAVPAAPAAIAAPGCTIGVDCPPALEGKGPLSEAAKEILKEFAKCAAEGKPFDQCLLDDPPPPTLTGLSDDERVQLTSCLGSDDLNATESLWNGCVTRVR